MIPSFFIHIGVKFYHILTALSVAQSVESLPHDPEDPSLNLHAATFFQKNFSLRTVHCADLYSSK